MSKLFNESLTKEDLLRRIGDISQIGGAKEYELTTGKSRGVRAVDIRTGTGLCFTVLPDRGMDIAWAEYKGIPLAFLSKTGVTAPHLFDNQDFLRSFFGGLLTTCGLTYMGAPCTDDGEELGLHGRISNIPAYDVGVTQEWDGDEFNIKLRGKLTESKVFGENITLTREISVILGGNIINITDTIENCGYEPTPLMLLYHFNFGYPLVNKETKLITNCTDIKPRDEQAKSGINNFDTFEVPIHKYSEQVFYHNPPKNAFVELQNQNLGIGVKLEFDGEKLPYLIEWKQVGEGDYVVGLEPSTNTPEGRARARENGELIHLKPKDKKEFKLKLSVTNI